MSIVMPVYSLIAAPEVQPPPSVSYSRASSGYRVHRDRKLKAESSGVLRHGYDASTGGFLGWYLTGSVTNLLKSSEDFRSSANGNPVTAWGNSNITPTADNLMAPNGETTGDLLAHAADGSAISQTISGFSSGDTITSSVFAKKGNVDFLRMEVGNLVSCWFNINTGATGSNGAGSGNVLFSRKAVENYANGWTRAILTVTTSSITSAGLNIFATASDGASSANGNTINLWGGMANVGQQAPYVKTTSAATTYNADVVTIATAAWLNTFLGEYAFRYEFMTPPVLSGTQEVFSLDDGTANERIRLYISSGTLYLDVIDGGASQLAPMNLGSVSTNTTYRVAISVKANEIKVCVNGGNVSSDVSASLPTVTTFRIGHDYANANHLNGYFLSLYAWAVTLSDSDMQRITQ
jgi:hypothetical protein